MIVPPFKRINEQTADHDTKIEVVTDGQIYRQFLNPGDKPEAEFEIGAKGVAAREYCNIHGLWKSS